MVESTGDGERGHRRWRGVAGAAVLILLVVGVGFLVRSALRADDRTLAAVGGLPPTTTTVPDRPAAPLPEPLPTTSATTAPGPTSSTVAPDTLGPEDRASLEGVGPVRVGMTLEEASAAAGQGISEVPGSGAGSDPAACYYAVPDTGQPKVSFMVVDGAIGRVDVDEGSTVVTVSGIGVGATEADVLATYGDRILVEPHPYDEGGRYLRYVPDDPTRSLIFETDGATVLRYRSGLSGPVSFIEGCA
ncbi:MAG: hypothetical protein M3503_07225 [Actinomycetota bacterium]|nr:hypothetical protein [Actinomycetota bacterium]